MRLMNRDSLPHALFWARRAVSEAWHGFVCRTNAWWWGVSVSGNVRFRGYARFYRHPLSHIEIHGNSVLNSSPDSNFLGVNHPCILSTVKEGARLVIGRGCGLSGTSIGCAISIVLDESVRCGVNTLITDSDWHWDDRRAGSDAPVHLHRNVWLGAGVTVLKGVTIGENTVVGAGSVVTRSLPPNVLAAGSPARVMRPL